MCQSNTVIRKKIQLQKLKIHGIFWIYYEFRSEYQVQLSPQFPFTFTVSTSFLLYSSQSRPESDRNSSQPNSNLNRPNSIYPFKNQTFQTRIWVWLTRISVGLWPGLAGMEEKGSGDSESEGKLWRHLDLIFTPKLIVYPENTVNF